MNTLQSQILFPIFLGICIVSSGQSPNHPAMPKLTPNSPEAAAMNRYGEYPVSMFTGIPDISIPLYEIKSGKFTVPITLSYHASGNKVNDFAPWAGLGWTLNVGGRISRKVMGKDDQTHTRNVRSGLDPTNLSDHLYLQQIANSTDDWDPEPDIYMYSFPGKSGKFIFGDHPTYTPIMIPYCGVKVAGKNTPNILTDEMGSIYTYGQTDNPSTEYPNKTGSDPVSGWILTKMVDAGRTDSVQLSYQSVGYGVLGQDYVDYITVDDEVVYNGCGQKWTSGVSLPVSYAITTMGNELVPNQISFSQGIIKFIPSENNRLDRSNFKSIDRIEIYSLNDLVVPMKIVKFYTNYFDNGTTKRLRLDSLDFIDKSGTTIERYKFDYNSDIHLPEIDSKSKDYWGYFNGRSNTLLVPRLEIPFTGDNYSSNTTRIIGSTTVDGREPSANHMQAYILNKITYPTGGYTTFEYETNKYLDNQTEKLAGGLRIYKIKNYTENGIATTKTYKYGGNESGYGRFNVYFNNFYYQTPAVIYQGRRCFCEEPNQYKRSRTFTSTPCTEINPYDGSPVVYANVTAYEGEEVLNTGKTIYTYTDEADTRQNCGPAIMYTICRGFRRNMLESKTVFRNDEGIYRKVSYLSNNYFKFPTENRYMGIKVAQVRAYDCAIEAGDVYEYSYCNVPVFLGDNLLISTLEHQYDADDETKYVAKSTTYDYNNEIYTQLISTTIQTSQNKQYTTSYKYTSDFTVAPYTEMTLKNIIGAPIQETYLLNLSDTIYSKKTFYKKYSKLFAPELVVTKMGTSPFQTRIRFYDYDINGNILSVSQENNLRITYIWGYNKNFPVAKIENASLEEVQTAFSGTIPELGSGGLSESQLNTLHTGLPNALTSTYTYDYLIGLKTQIDPNKNTTFYEYDDFGRLKNIKDNTGNILKSYEYHYKTSSNP